MGVRTRETEIQLTCKVTLLHLLGKEVHLAPSVAIDDGLRDCQRRIEITKSVELPFFSLDGDEELLDTLQGKLVPLDQNADGVPHELEMGEGQVVIKSGDQNRLRKTSCVRSNLPTLDVTSSTSRGMVALKMVHCTVSGMYLKTS